MDSIYKFLDGSIPVDFTYLTLHMTWSNIFTHFESDMACEVVGRYMGMQYSWLINQFLPANLFIISSIDDEAWWAYHNNYYCVMTEAVSGGRSCLDMPRTLPHHAIAILSSYSLCSGCNNNNNEYD